MLAAVCAAWPGGADGKAPPNNLVVYGPVPGLAASDHYALRVRMAGGNGPWQNAFVFKTACKDFGRIDLNKTRGKPGVDTEGYAAHLSGWSHSYVNFEGSSAEFVGRELG
jgi:hypothetical protein